MEKVLSRKSVQIPKSLIFSAIRAAVSKGRAAPSLTMNERPKLESENRRRSGRGWVNFFCARVGERRYEDTCPATQLSTAFTTFDLKCSKLCSGPARVSVIA